MNLQGLKADTVAVVTNYTGVFVIVLLGGMLLGWMIGRPSSGYTWEWEQRIVAYQADSIRFEQGLRLLRSSMRRAEDSARTLEGVAHAERSRADQLASQSTKSQRLANATALRLADQTNTKDSLSVVLVAYEARSEEAATLRQEVGSLREVANAQQQALGQMHAALDSSKRVSDELQTRLTLAEDLIRDRPQNDKCRVLWFNCPSRTTVAVVSAVVGFAGGVYVAAR